MTVEDLKFFSGIDPSGALLFFVARTKKAMRQMIRDFTGFTEWESLSLEQIYQELNPFVGPHFVSLVPDEFDARPEATVFQFPEEAMRFE